MDYLSGTGVTVDEYVRFWREHLESMLYISYNTVKNHIYNLYQKLGVNSRWQMLHLVLEARDQQAKSAR